MAECGVLPVRKKKKISGMKKQMKNMSREAIEATIQKKKECNKVAMQIVERLIEPNVDEVWMLNNLFHINQTHFDDVVEERSIVRFCGYPLCDNTLGHIPSKQFQISTKQNKVYDITDRKKYCSNLCYKAGKYIKDQLCTSPLWLRDYEEVVIYKLFPAENKSGGSGIEIDIGFEAPVKPDLEQTCDSYVEEEAILSKECAVDDLKEEMKDCDIRVQEEVTVSERMEETTEVETVIRGVDKISLNVSECIPKNSKRSLNESNEAPNKRGTKTPKRSGKAQVTMQDVVVKIERNIRSWFTFDTLCFLLGSEKVKELLLENGTPLNELSLAGADPYVYERYADICRKLNVLEIQESQAEVEPEPVKKPLPDFKQLVEEAKEIEIKVKAFYQGDKVVKFEEPQKEDNDEEQPTPVIPLVDHHAMKAARRKIVLDKLNKTLPDIQRALGLSSIFIGTEVKELVGSLNLSATNINFRPSEWSFVAIIIIKLLSLRDEILCKSFESDLVRKYLQLILMSYNLDLGYLDRLVCWLTDITYLLPDSVTNKF